MKDAGTGLTIPLRLGGRPGLSNKNRANQVMHTFIILSTNWSKGMSERWYRCSNGESDAMRSQLIVIALLPIIHLCFLMDNWLNW